MPTEKSPDAFRTISEVAEWLDVPAHVLRFWESRFTQVKPVKRAGGRRYYRRTDMQLLDAIRKLLHDDGMTIRAVQSMLREKGVKTVAALGRALEDAPEAPMAEDVPVAEPAEKVVRFPTAEPPAEQPAAEVADEPEFSFDSAGPAFEPAPPETAASEPPADAAPPEEWDAAPEPAEPEPAALPDLPPDPEDDDPAFAVALRTAAALSSADPAKLAQIRDRLLAIRRRMGNSARRPPAG